MGKDDEGGSTGFCKYTKMFSLVSVMLYILQTKNCSKKNFSAPGAESYHSSMSFLIEAVNYIHRRRVLLLRPTSPSCFVTSRTEAETTGLLTNMDKKLMLTVFSYSCASKTFLKWPRLVRHFSV